MSEIKKKTNEKKSGFERFLSGRGYYAVIAVAVLAVGAAAFAATRSGVPTPQEMKSEYGDLIDFKNDSERQVAVPKEDVRAAPDKIAPQEAEKPQTKVVAKEKETKKPPVKTAEKKFAAPIKGKLVMGHSQGESIYSETMKDYRQHDGVDIAAAVGTEVQAAADGTIDGIYFEDLWGEVIVLSHAGGLKTVYKNLSSEICDGIRPGAAVSCGMTIGKVGNEGIIESASDSHLHFELLKDDKSINPSEKIPLD